MKKGTVRKAKPDAAGDEYSLADLRDKYETVANGLADITDALLIRMPQGQYDAWMEKGAHTPALVIAMIKEALGIEEKEIIVSRIEAVCGRAASGRAVRESAASRE